MNENTLVVAIVTVIALAVVSFMALALKMGNESTKAHNEAIVKCIEAGKPPLECKAAIGG